LIYSSFGTLSDSIVQLETFGLSFYRSIETVQTVENKIQLAENKIFKKIKFRIG
jgi:hypothetical protein